MSARGELGRKVVHLATAVVPVWIYLVPPPWSHRGPLLAFLAVLAVDVLRIGHGATHRWFDRRVGAYLRPGERRRLISVHYLTGAAAFLAFVLPPALAATAMGYLVVGDAAAALVGRFGRVRLGRKSLEGSLACLVCCLALGAWLLPDRPAAIVAGAVAATLVELAPLPLDDNLSVPLAAAAVLALLA